MIPLSEGRYQVVMPKLQEVTINNLFARAVVERCVDGRVYVDDDADPSAFHVVHPYGMSLLFGDVSDAFLQHEVWNYLLGRNDLRQTAEWLQVFPRALEGRIDEVLGNRLGIWSGEDALAHSDRVVIKHERANFKFNRQKHEQFLSTIDLNDYVFASVDATLFNETSGSVVPKKFWNSASDFLTHGVGFALVVQERAVSVAFSSFCHDSKLELGMESRPEHRNKGYASIVSAKLIDYCLAHDLEPIWSCRLGNSGSYRLAVKLGFEPTMILPYYELKRPAVCPEE